MDFGLKGKTVVVTGASSGIGRVIAIHLAQNGANLAVLARRSDRLKTVATKAAGLGVIARAYTCDVSDSQQVQATFEAITADFQSVFGLVNNAGVSTKAKDQLMASTVAAMDTDYGVNMRGAFLCTQAVHPLMRDGGSIVNISSIRAHTGSPSGSIGYAAAKAGVINITKSFAQQLGGRGIRVNCVAPGAIYPTEMSQDWSHQLQEEIIASCPLGRLGEPEDIAHAVCFLLSDLASYITGCVLDVNGGRWMS